MDKETPVIGMVGKIARGRGFDVLLEAAARSQTRCRVLAVGHGELQPELEHFAREKNISDRIVWAGKRESDLPLLFAAMDAVVFAAPGSDWGHRAISEAQACGRPVIATAIPGIEDLLDHEITGLIAEDAKGIAAAFDRLVADPALERHLGQNASEATADRRFSTVGGNLADFLEGLTAVVRSPGRGTR